MEPLDVAHRAEGDHGDVDVESCSVRQRGLADPAVALERADLDPRAKVDAVGALEVGGDLADHVAKRTAKRRGAALDQRDVEPELAADRRDLRPGEAAADHEHTPRLVGEQRMELRCVIARAHGDDAIERAFVRRPATAGCGRRWRSRAGRSRRVRPSASRDLPLPAIQTRRRDAQQPLDIVEVGAAVAGRSPAAGAKPSGTCFDSGGRSYGSAAPRRR